MDLLLNTYRKNLAQRPLFSEIIDIDFYDGPTEALCRLDDSEQWLICSLVYYDIMNRIRIFTLLEIGADELLKFKSILEKGSSNQIDFFKKLKAQIRDVYITYSGKVFLFKSDWLKSTEYQVVEMPRKQLQYFSDIEEVLEESEKSKEKWMSFFSMPNDHG